MEIVRSIYVMPESGHRLTKAGALNFHGIKHLLTSTVSGELWLMEDPAYDDDFVVWHGDTAIGGQMGCNFMLNLGGHLVSAVAPVNPMDLIRYQNWIMEPLENV